MPRPRDGRLDLYGDGNPSLIVWSDNGVVVLKNGTVPLANTGLENLKGVVSIAPGDFNNDGLPDLAVITHSAHRVRQPERKI